MSILAEIEYNDEPNNYDKVYKQVDDIFVTNELYDDLSDKKGNYLRWESKELCKIKKYDEGKTIFRINKVNNGGVKIKVYMCD